MEIQNIKAKTNFGGVYVTSSDAQKLLNKADRIIKANYKTNYTNTNIPEGHKKPLWSILKKHLEERQANNPNNIIIDIADKVKQLLSIKTLDNKGYTIKTREVSPIPRIGTCNEIMPTDDMYRTSYNSFDKKSYGCSDFFEMLEKAEYEVDALFQKQLEIIPESQTSIRELPRKQKKPKDSNVILNPRRIEKAKGRIQLHIQKPFEDLKSMLSVEQPKTKLETKPKEKIPRRLKKESKNKQKNIIINPRRLEKAKAQIQLHIEKPIEDVRTMQSLGQPKTNATPQNKNSHIVNQQTDNKQKSINLAASQTRTKKTTWHPQVHTQRPFENLRTILGIEPSKSKIERNIKDFKDIFKKKS